VAGSPAERAGLKSGDLIVAIDGTKIDTFERVKQVVTNSVGRELEFKVERNKNILALRVTPEIKEEVDERGQKMVDVIIGVKRNATPDTVTTYRPGPIEAVGRGIEYTGFIIKSTLFWIYDVFAGRHRIDQLGGVGRIADITTKVVERSAFDVIYLIGFLSVGIGLLNLFPIPLLDGGHLVFYAIEAIRRKPLSEQTMEMSFRFGFAVVLMLMVLAFYNDRFIYRDWALGLAKVLGIGA
jgi:regulator of sigma E protease